MEDFFDLSVSATKIEIEREIKARTDLWLKLMSDSNSEIDVFNNLLVFVNEHHGILDPKKPDERNMYLSIGEKDTKDLATKYKEKPFSKLLLNSPSLAVEITHLSQNGQDESIKLKISVDKESFATTLNRTFENGKVVVKRTGECPFIGHKQ